MNLHLSPNCILFFRIASSLLGKENLLDGVDTYLCEAMTKFAIVLYSNIFVIPPERQQFSDAVLDYNIIPLNS